MILPVELVVASCFCMVVLCWVRVGFKHRSFTRPAEGHQLTSQRAQGTVRHHELVTLARFASVAALAAATVVSARKVERKVWQPTLACPPAVLPAVAVVGAGRGGRRPSCLW